MQRVVDCLKASPSVTDVEISAGQPCPPACTCLPFAAYLPARGCVTNPRCPHAAPAALSCLCMCCIPMCRGPVAARRQQPEVFRHLSRPRQRGSSARQRRAADNGAHAGHVGTRG